MAANADDALARARAANLARESRSTFDKLGGAVGAAFEAENLTVQSIQALLEPLAGERKVDYAQRKFNDRLDPDFRLDADMIQQFATDYGISNQPLPPDSIFAQLGIKSSREAFSDALSGAMNEQHAVEIAERFRASLDRDEALAELPLGLNLALRIGAGTLDPVFLIPGAKLAQFYNAPTRLSRAVRAGITAGVLSGSQEYLTGIQQSTKTETDVWLALTGGLALGGALGAATGAARTADDIDSGASVEDIGNAVIRGSEDAAVVNDTSELIDVAGIGIRVGDEQPEIPKARDPDDDSVGDNFGADSAGGARADAAGRDLKDLRDGILNRVEQRQQDMQRQMYDDDLEPDDLQLDPQGARNPGRLRFDSLKTLLDSPVSQVRSLGATLFDEQIGFLNRRFVQHETVDKLKRRLDSAFRNPIRRSMIEGFDDWAKRRGLNVYQRRVASSRHVDEFNAELAAYIRDRDGVMEQSVDPAVKRTAEVVRRQFASILKVGQDVRFRDIGGGETFGVFSRNIAEDPHYLPRVYNELKLRQLADVQTRQGNIGEAALRELIEVAARRAHPEMTPRAIQIMAKAHVQAIMRRAHGINEAVIHGLPADDVDELRRVLRDDAKMQPDEIDELVEAVTKRVSTQTRIPNARFRLDIDESAEIPLADGGTLRVSDILENNVDILVQKYSNRVTGAIALKRNVNVTGSDTEIQRITDEIREAHRQAGSVDQTVINREVDTAKAFIRHLAGKPIFDNEDHLSVSARATRALRQFNFSVYMTQSGLASIAELGMVAQIGGWGLLKYAVTDFRRLMRNIKTGQIDDEFVDFFDQYLGLGADNLLRPMFSRMDDFSDTAVDARVGPDAGRLTRNLGRAENITAEMQRFVGEYVSLLGPLTRMQRRLTSLGILKRLEDYGLKGRALKANEIARLRDMGISPEVDLPQIRELMRKYGISFQGGFKQRTGRRTDLERWSNSPDPAERLMFDRVMNAIARETDRTIIEGNISSAPLWVHKDIGRISTQFMTFAINAHQKLFLRGIDKHDADTALMFLYSSMFAGLALTVQNEANHRLFDPDRADRFYEDPAKPGGFLWKVFARAGQAAMLPSIVDATGNLTGTGPLFNARTSGLPSGTLASIPSIQTLDAAVRTAQVPFDLMNPNVDVSHTNVESSTDLIPIVRNALGVRGAIDALISSMNLPRGPQ